MGKYLFKNGTRYEGEFRNDCFEGVGKLTYPNGDWFQGGFHENLK